MTDQKQLAEERVYLAFIPYSQSIIKRNKDRSSSREPRSRNYKNKSMKKHRLDPHVYSHIYI